MVSRGCDFLVPTDNIGTVIWSVEYLCGRALKIVCNTTWVPAATQTVHRLGTDLFTYLVMDLIEKHSSLYVFPSNLPHFSYLNHNRIMRTQALELKLLKWFLSEIHSDLNVFNPLIKYGKIYTIAAVRLKFIIPFTKVSPIQISSQLSNYLSSAIKSKNSSMRQL